MATIYAGTAGFAYPTWKPAFYPADVPAARFLEHYASRLNCVEANYTFRRMPSESTLAAWVRATSPGFMFAVKAHQRITHFARLKDAVEPTEFFLHAIEPLRAAGRLGPVLFQLPPTLHRDDDRLEKYLSLLPSGYRITVEFRHESWLVDEVFDLLRRHDVALCVAETEALVVPDIVTASFAYFRLRKPQYSHDEIERFGARARELSSSGRDAYLIFKHEETPAGALEAEEVLRAA